MRQTMSELTLRRTTACLVYRGAMNKSKLLFTILGLMLVFCKLSSQEITGFVIDSVSELPLTFVNVGVLGVPTGTVTNEIGAYSLNCEKLPANCEIQISMIGYQTQTFSINDLKSEYKTIKLVRKAINIEEVTVNWQETTRKIGTTKASKMSGVCGWGGTDFGKGHELGLRLCLGDKTVKLEDINLNICKHSFDTIIIRLHIRTIKNGLPADELLTENIYLPITKSKGWQQFDLTSNNIMLSGDIALSIEWVKVSNVIEKNLIKINGAKKGTPNVLFDINSKKGTFFIRKGSAAKWMIQENSSPAFYITVK